MSPVSYLTSTVPDGIPLVGSYTLCDNSAKVVSTSFSLVDINLFICVFV